ncbi:hypothetical protein KCU78_g5960, partial [Aureobasidium melanogenum]
MNEPALRPVKMVSSALMLNSNSRTSTLPAMEVRRTRKYFSDEAGVDMNELAPQAGQAGQLGFDAQQQQQNLQFDQRW